MSWYRSVLLHWVPVSDTRNQYTSLRSSLSCDRSVLQQWIPVSDTIMAVHMTEAKFLLLEVSTTQLIPSIWHHDVSRHDWGKVSTAGGLYYYIESQYLTHEIRTHHWGQVSTARGQYNYIVSKYLTHEVSTHRWDQGSFARGQNYYIESQYLTPRCQDTWLRQSFYCWRSVLLHWVPVSDNWSKYLSLRPSFYC